MDKLFYTKEVKEIVNKKLIDQVTVAIRDFDSTTDNAYGVIAALGGLLIMAREINAELDRQDKEENDEENVQGD